MILGEHPNNALIKYHKHGIYLQYQSNDITYRRFIYIKTLSQSFKFPLKIYSHEELEEMKAELHELRNKYTNEGMPYKMFLHKVNKIRDKYIPVKFPLSGQRARSWVKIWKKQRERLLIRQQLEKLHDDSNVEIQINHLHRDRILILLVDYGPLYRSDHPKKKIITRSSPLSLYPRVKWLKHTVELDRDFKVQIKPYVHRHLQDRKIDDHALAPLFKSSHVQEDDTYSQQFYLLDQYFAKNYFLSPNYLFSINYDRLDAEFVDHIRNPDFDLSDRFIHYSAMPGMILQLQTDQFHQFLLNYTSRTEISGRHLHIGKSGNEKIILLSRSHHNSHNSHDNHLNNYTIIDPNTIRLDLIHFNRSNVHLTYSLINALDIINGDRYFSVISDFAMVIDEINEFDETILTDTRSLADLRSTLARQMTNTSYIGNTEDVIKIYHLLRQTQIGKTFNPATKVNHKKAKNLPQYSIIDTNRLSSQDATILVFALMLTIGHQVPLHEQKEITLVIEDQRIIDQFYHKEVKQFFDTIRERNPNLKIIFSLKPGTRPLFSHHPVLSIDDMTGQTEISIGSSHKFAVSIDWLTISEEIQFHEDNRINQQMISPEIGGQW